MSMNLRTSPLALAAMAAAAVGGLGLQAEVEPRPPGLGEWLRRNNRHKETAGAFGAPKVKQGHQRLQRASGPGSINERNEMFALIEAGKPQEAAEYYRRCLNINYRAGKVKLHRDMVTWYAYYN